MALDYTLSLSNTNISEVFHFFDKLCKLNQTTILKEIKNNKEIIICDLFQEKGLVISIYKYPRIINFSNFNFVSDYSISFRLNKNKFDSNMLIPNMLEIILMLIDSLPFANYLFSFNGEIVILYSEDSLIKLNNSSNFWTDKLKEKFKLFKHIIINDSSEIIMSKLDRMAQRLTNGKFKRKIR